MSIESILNKKYDKNEHRYLPLYHNRTARLDKEEPFTSFAFMLSKILMTLDQSKTMVLSYLDNELCDPTTEGLIRPESKEILLEELTTIKKMHSRLRSSIIRVIEEKNN